MQAAYLAIACPWQGSDFKLKPHPKVWPKDSWHCPKDSGDASIRFVTLVDEDRWGGGPVPLIGRIQNIFPAVPKFSPFVHDFFISVNLRWRLRRCFPD